MRPQSVYSGMLFLVYVAIGNLLCSMSFSSLNVLIKIEKQAYQLAAKG
jgi:hypothetical protein